MATKKQAQKVKFVEPSLRIRADDLQMVDKAVAAHNELIGPISRNAYCVAAVLAAARATLAAKPAKASLK